jgi:lysophospholipase L1-like esterase
MASKHYLVGGAAALLAAAVITACSSSKDVTVEQAVDPMFQSYASLGNSVTAGYQSGGINDSTQRMSYPLTFANAAHTRFAQPSLAMPGCAPPIDNFLTLHRVTPIGYPPSTGTSCYLRTESSVTGAINNVAVPGAASVDPTAAVSLNQNALTTFILGGATQVQRAAQVNPTFVTMWIGNNDVLSNALSGCLVPTASCIATPMTPLNTFIANYKADVNGLRAIASLKGAAVFGVLDVTNLPTLFQAQLLHSPGGFSVDSAVFAAASGGPFTLDASCYNSTPGSAPLINIAMAGAIAAGSLPHAVICKKGVFPAPVGDLYVLDSVEVPLVIAQVAAYNNYIHAKADSVGWIYIDPNPALAALRAANLVPAFPALSPTVPFGNYFSLDGIHPSGKTDTLIANILIDSVNARYGLSVPNVP